MSTWLMINAGLLCMTGLFWYLAVYLHTYSCMFYWVVGVFFSVLSIGSLVTQFFAWAFDWWI